MENIVKVWTETVTLPTYQVGKVDTNPIFLEKRVYQGSSGSVYPYGVIDSITNECVNQEYKAVFLENDFIYVMLLPELGGRIHKAYDKVHQRDFVYCNDVIKPALVGLVGPWISGGIEFNWPQHHRPTTYMPVDVNVRELADGSAEVWLGEVEHMYGLQVSTGFKLYPNKALIEITGRVYNSNPTPQQFLWWANPAVKGGDDHQSIFPPDVTAVYDHGKRDVSAFPIAKGTYYKVDYSAGVDISRYKNLPVPTSYMAAKSDYDFVGAYSHDERGGLLHVANHHISTGKKQWSWGNCEFGQAWDRQLTDSNGPYIELMTGVFTDNQPDFTWIDPNEEKIFVQNFLPYSELGLVHQANTDVAVNLIRQNEQVRIGVYAISAIENAVVTVKVDTTTVYSGVVSLLPCQCQFDDFAFGGNEQLTLEVLTQQGRKTLTYTEQKESEEPTPDPATAPKMPTAVESIDELYFIGQHLEQYHHATRHAVDYYLEALRRDEFDYRCNVAMANREFERCDYERSLHYANNALHRAHQYNKNPLCGRASLIRGHANEKLGLLQDAYADFYKSTWSGNCNDAGFLAASRISFKQGRYLDALEEVERVLELNSMSYEAAFVKLVVLEKLKSKQALDFAKQSLERFPLGYGLAMHHYLLTMQETEKQVFIELCQSRQANAIHVASLYTSLNLNEEALLALELINAQGAASNIIRASLLPDSANALLNQAEQEFASHVLFPNAQVEVNALMHLSGYPFADYLLGCFHYAKKSYDKAVALWEQVIEARPEFKEAHRNLAIYYANKKKDIETALKCMDAAWQLDNNDARVLYELDDLRKIALVDPKTRLMLLEPHQGIIMQRDDLVTEFITLLNICHEHDRALAILKERTFAPWEGGEGRVTGQYVNALIRKSLSLIKEKEYVLAKQALIEALEFPLNLNEGRLVGQTDNDIYYLLGQIEQKLGEESAAKQMYQRALAGDSEVTESRYYNDMPADYLLFQTLAMYQLGEQERAVNKFKDMAAWVTSHESQQVEHDFFAVSLPQLNVFDKDIQTNHRTHCQFVDLLAKFGLAQIQNQVSDEVNNAQHALLDSDPNHAKAHLLSYLSSVSLTELA